MCLLSVPRLSACGLLSVALSPEAGHIRELLGISSPAPPLSTSRLTPPETPPSHEVEEQTHESPVLEPVASPPKEGSPKPVEGLVDPLDDAMEVDEDVRVPSPGKAHTPVPPSDELLSQANSSDALLVEALILKQEDPPRSTPAAKSPSPPRIDVDAPAAQELLQPTKESEPPTPALGDEMEIELPTPVEAARVEGDEESPTAAHHTPLPIARVESQQSISEYTLDIKPAPPPPPPAYDFDKALPGHLQEEKPVLTVSPMQTLYKSVDYPLPPMKSLPPEYHRRSKKQSKKRDKDKSENKSQDWAPLGLNKWCAVLRANPVHTKIVKAKKCVSTRDWNVRIPFSSRAL